MERINSVSEIDLIEDRYYRDSPSLKHNLSFAGCGFLGLYHVGVCCCIKQFAPQLYQNKPVSGTSAGAIAAACLICELDMNMCVQYFCKIVENAKWYTLGPFDPRFKVNEHLREGLSKILPSDAHVLCSNRLSISLTCFATRKNIIVRQFKDKDELIKALLCSAYIPIFSGFVPLSFRGQLVVDGGLSDNLLNINQQTIRVSPFAGDADICPLESKCGPQHSHTQPQSYEDVLGSITLLNLTMRLNLTNIKRLIGMVWPMNSDQLVNLATQGYDDALRFLITRGFIACRIHQTPREFSNISRSKQRNNATRIRRLPSFDTLLYRKVNEESDRYRKYFTDPSSNTNVPKSTRSSTPRKVIPNSGIGLNVANCRACQDSLCEAINTSFPASLRLVIKKGTNPPPSYLRCIQSRVFSYGSSVCSFGFNLVRFPLSLQVKVLICVVSKCLQALKQSDVSNYYLSSLLDLLKQSYLYLEDSKDKTVCSPDYSNSESSQYTRYHSVPEKLCSVFSVINSVLEKGTDNMSDLLLRLSSVELPTAKDCGLELLSSPIQQKSSVTSLNLVSVQKI
uniref:PNPLA domain-containing protein n=1 Tax=Trichobilharzia regenti TaxID=157069 RepID=A0AA85JY91_TRIRE|nr:unnamed protein product [Trichobilharzia regenti]